MRLAPGDLLELRLPEGFAYGRVLMLPAAYPPAIGFLPGLSAEPLADAGARLEGARPVILLCPLERLAEAGRVRVLGPGAPRPVTFRVPVRDRTGRILYHWAWDGTGIALPEGDAAGLPVREIVPPDALPARLDATRKA